jgi:hypothetical protein
MTLHDRFRALFSPQRRWIDASGASLGDGGRFGPKEGVLPRAASIYRRFDFTALPPARRRAALDVATRHGPSQGPARSACRWQEGIAHVWTPRAPLDVADDLTLVAETSLLPPPAVPDAVRLVALEHGVEGQVWSSGVLAASRWWPSPPSPEPWSRFLRAAGRQADGELPAVETLSLASSPWGEAHERLAWRPAQLEALAWKATVLAVALVLGWQLAALATWSLADALQAHRLDSVRAESAPLIAARERAEAAQQRLQALAELVEGPVDLALLADVRGALDPAIRVVGWARDGERLRVDLQGAGTDPRPIVQAFAGHPQLAAVVANPIDAGRMQLEVELPASSTPVAP